MAPGVDIGERRAAPLGGAGSGSTAAAASRDDIRPAEAA